jgi:hypothetical protein
MASYLPLNPPPNEDDYRKAQNRLHDPEARLVHEFFWFWPQDIAEAEAEDEVLPLLKQGRVNDALKLWVTEEREGSETTTSSHNIAVLTHTVALDLEWSAAGKALKEQQLRTRDASWSAAYKRWQRLINDERFWSRLTARIRELQADEPRLTTGAARRIRECLPKAILSINAQLAVRAAEQSDQANAGRHVSLMRNSGFGDSLVHETLLNGLSPIRQRIRMACEQTKARADAAPEEADRAASELLDGSKPLLTATDTLLPEGDPTREGIHDEVAERALECQFASWKASKNGPEALRALKAVLTVAEGRSLRERIGENLETLEGIVREERERDLLKRDLLGNKVYDVTVQGRGAKVPGVCSCCLSESVAGEQVVTRSWDEWSGVSRVRKTLSFGFPLCVHCRQHQSELRSKLRMLVLLSTGISATLVYAIGASAESIDCAGLVGIGLALSGAIFAVLSGLIRVRDLGTEHGSRGRAVSLMAASASYMTFRFWNPLYASGFAKANDSKVKAGTVLKHSRGRYLCLGRSGALAVAWTLGVALVAHLIVYGILDGQRRKPSGSTGQGQPVGSSSTRGTYTYGAGGGATRPIRQAQDAELTRLNSEIASAKERLRTMEADLNQLDSQLALLAPQIDGYRRTLDACDERARLGQWFDQVAYRQSLAAHNDLVNRHNDLLLVRRSRGSAYKAELDRANSLIDRYNSRIR